MEIFASPLIALAVFAAMACADARATEGPTVYRTAHGRHVTTFAPSTGKIDWTVPSTALEGVAARYESELYDRIVPFWTRHSIDRACGGYLTCLDREGKVYDTTKDMWLEWREVYMFAALNNRGRKNSEWIALARHGYDFLTAKGRNPDGSYATVISRDGAKKTTAAPLVAIFTHGFAAMACAELYRFIEVFSGGFPSRGVMNSDPWGSRYRFAECA